MNVSHQAQSHRTLTFHQLEDLIKTWSLETEKAEKIFHNMIKDIFQIDRHIEANQKKCENLMRLCLEVQNMQCILDAQLLDLSSDLAPLENIVCCLEQKTCYPLIIDCQKHNLYSLVEELFLKGNYLYSHAEELASLLETQKIILKITKILSLKQKCLSGLLTKIEQAEKILLPVTQQHDKFLKFNISK